MIWWLVSWFISPQTIGLALGGLALAVRIAHMLYQNSGEFSWDLPRDVLLQRLLKYVLIYLLFCAAAQETKRLSDAYGNAVSELNEANVTRTHCLNHARQEAVNGKFIRPGCEAARQLVLYESAWSLTLKQFIAPWPNVMNVIYFPSTLGSGDMTTYVIIVAVCLAAAHSYRSFVTKTKSLANRKRLRDSAAVDSFWKRLIRAEDGKRGNSSTTAAAHSS
jgi:hypothetical protein